MSQKIHVMYIYFILYTSILLIFGGECKPHAHIFSSTFVKIGMGLKTVSKMGIGLKTVKTRVMTKINITIVFPVL